MSRIKGYIFTNKKHSVRGIMSTVFGAISITSNGYAITESFHRNGQVPVGFGAALLFTLILAFAGLIMGIVSRTESDKFYFFTYLGIMANVIALAMSSLILYAGTM